MTTHRVDPRVRAPLGRLVAALVATTLVIAALAALVHTSATSASLASLPGVAPYSAELATRLQRALLRRPSGAAPRTRHRNADGSPKYTNRLILESSPYLLQHAHNPVDWYPWGDEAFARAKREQKPVLLSIGYSTCHWCHVMEEESFDDEDIAAYLNAHYVAIKVDREQRPDIDGVYMAAVQRLTGSGGWPLNVWLTPDRQPFYGGTYFPPRDGVRGVRVGLRTLLERLQAIYAERADSARQAGEDLARELGLAAQTKPSASLPTTTALLLGYAHFRNTFDGSNGGFGTAPKFPRPAGLAFLLRYHRRTGNAPALDMVVRTLDAMARGGIYDHIGGGFHRYATDAAWRIPHFEKMLYDNALLAGVYLDAYQVTRDAVWADVVRDTLRYVEREMTSPDGGFYAATDADSDGVEGQFFAWTPAEIEAVVGADDATLVNAYYGVSDAGNFDGRNVLTVARALADVAQERGLDVDTATARIANARTALYAARQQRIAPHTDRKVIAGWNGLMISVFARAAAVLDDPAYARVAERAADFVLSRLRRNDRLRRSAVEGTVSGDGYLDDYAFVVAALIDLFETTHERAWLAHAIALQRVLDEHFWDETNGGYFFTGDDHEALVAREKPAYDGSEPSGNSVALLNLLRLYALTSDETYREHAEQGLRQFARALMLSPGSVPYMLAGLDFYTDTAKEIVIVVPRDTSEARPFLAKRSAAFIPNSVIAVVREGSDRDALAQLMPLVAEKEARKGLPTAYVCERKVCDLPTNDPDVFARQLAKVETIPGSDKAEAIADGHGGMGMSRR